jgi:hypothetical protein
MTRDQLEIIGIVVGIIVGAASAILFVSKVVLALIRKIQKKHYVFDISSGNLVFASFYNSTLRASNTKKPLCLLVHNLCVVNRAGKSATIKCVALSYQYKGKKYQTEATHLHTYIEPVSGDPVLAIHTLAGDKINVKPWRNIREVLQKMDLLQPSGVLSGSCAFVFEPCVEDAALIENLSLVVNDFNNIVSVQLLTPGDDAHASLARKYTVVNG